MSSQFRPQIATQDSAKPAITDDLFRLLVESVKDYAIFLLDPGGHIVTWNEGAQRLKGYQASEIIGRHFSVFYPPEVAASGHPEDELREAERVGRFEEEGWRIRKDGTRFWADVVITAVRDSTGVLRGFAKVTRDLTERKTSEDLLRESEERYRLLISDIPDYAIYLLDPNGRVVTWNPGAERLYGYGPEVVVGEHFSRFYPADAVASGWPDEELRIARAQGRFEDEGWRMRRDGSRFWANVVITALHDREDRLYGFSKITRDMTERRNHEEAMRNLNRELQLRVEQLGYANRILAEKSEENEAFVYSVSHDVRGPLVNLQGFAQELDLSCADLRHVLAGAGLPPDATARISTVLDRDIPESIHYIQSSVRHLGGIIDSLLRLSRAGRVVYQLNRVEVGPLVRRVVDSLQGSITAAGAEVEILELPPAQSDSTALEQVFANLVSNALQYRDRTRQCRIQIGATPESGGSASHHYFVKDNGVGIPESAMPRLFTAFQRLHPESGPGEGIGLAMVRRVLDRLHGRIRAESRVGSGTTFFIELPKPAEPVIA